MTTEETNKKPRRNVTANLPKATIVRKQNVTHDLWLIWLKPDVSFGFKPGQYCTIGVDEIERPYSIASSPDEDLIELFIELVPKPDGVLTPLLYDLNEGDQVTIRPRAKGIFTLDQNYTNHLMVSTVTGVAPYVSMLRDLEHNNNLSDAKIYVIEGASFSEEFVYDKELESFDSRYPNVTFVPTVSRPEDPKNKEWTGTTGRANEIVERYLQEFGLLREDTLVYACGHPGMIEDVKERMDRLDFPFKEERFWKD